MLWTRNATASERVCDEAAIAQDFGKLVSVRIPELAASELPAGFWQSSIFLLTDREKLYRALRNSSSPKAPRAAPAPAAASESSRPAPESAKRRSETLAAPALSKESAERYRLPEEPAAQVQAGKLVENVPRVMRTGIASEVEVRLSREDTEALIAGLKGQVHKHNILTTPAMTVTLQAPDGGFQIQSLSRETQWIDGSYGAKLGLLGQPDYGCWKWIVTPQESGTRRLNIVAAAKTSDGGVQAETPLPEQIVQVKVRINYLRTFKEFSQWLMVAAAGGLVAEYATTVFKLLAHR